MAGRVKEVAMGTRTARLKLKPRHKPYFRLITEGVHLTYRRSIVPNTGGAWGVRRYLGDKQYETAKLGQADDLPHVPADGKEVLTFAQAEAAARAWANGQADAERTAAKATGRSPETVRTAIESYVAERTTRSARAGANARRRLSHHVLNAPIADIAILDLTEQHLHDWRTGLKRGGRAKVKSDAPIAPATVVRLLNDVRAALNEGARRARVPADLILAIKDGLRGPKGATRHREKQVLTDAEVRRILDSADGIDEDFGALVALLAWTGARFDQLARLKVTDLQVNERRIMVPVTAKGDANKQITHIPVPLPDQVVARLEPLGKGHLSNEPLLLRWHHRQVAGDPAQGRAIMWEKVERRPWQHATEMARMWQATLTAAKLPKTLVPYSLRHSSIVRQLRGRLPVSLVARAHDTSESMIRKHYGAYIVDVSEDLLRQTVMSLAG